MKAIKPVLIAFCGDEMKTQYSLHPKKVFDTFLILITCLILISGCSSGNWNLKKESTTINANAEWLGSKIGFLYTATKEYEVAEDVSKMLWLEELISRGYKEKYIRNVEEAKWIREFYANRILEVKKANNVEEFKRVIEEYASDNPPPINQIVEVDAIMNASGDSNNGWRQGIQVALPKGVWQIKPIGGGWSAWPSDSAVPPNVRGAWTWNLYIKRPFEQRSSFYGTRGEWWRFKNADDAFSSVQNETAHSFLMPQAGTVSFWIWDEGGTDSNRGHVAIEISRKN